MHHVALQLILRLLAIALLAAAMLSAPVMAKDGHDCGGAVAITAAAHSHSVAHATGCCSPSHCCPVLPASILIAGPDFADIALEDEVRSGQPFLLVRTLDPPPRSSVA